jgi:hypothetical protein
MTVETNSNTKLVQFDPDGEGVDFTDLIELQRREQVRLFNVLLSGGMADGLGDGAAPNTKTTLESLDALNGLGFSTSDVVIAPWSGAAFPYASVVANTIAISAGPFVVAIDEPWNADGEEFAIARTGGVSLASAVGDATNPRIDIVEVKLEYVDTDTETRHFEDATTRAPSSQVTAKRRSVQATFQIKQGAPAASPAYPTPSAGFVAYAAVYVPATHNAVHGPDNIRDLRVPMGVRAIDVDLKGMHKTGINPWTDLGMLAASAVSTDHTADRVVVPCPVASKSARLLGVGIFGYPVNAPAFEIVRVNYPATGGAVTTQKIVDLSLDVFVSDGLTFADAMKIADRAHQTGIILGSRVANTHVGTPVWCNGKTSGMAHAGVAGGAGQTPGSKLGVSFGADGAGNRAAFVRFWIAEGL